MKRDDESTTSHANPNPRPGWISQRAGFRSQITTVLKKVEKIRDGTQEYDAWELKKACQKLESYQAKLFELDEKILHWTDDEAARNTESERTMSYNDNLMDEILEIQEMIAVRSAQTPVNQNLSTFSNEHGADLAGTGTRSVMTNFKLPKFEMGVFSGDPLKWRGWWDIFKKAIHENPTMSAVEKFSYLVGYLSGDALAVVEGYELSEANYTQVIGELTERFGDKQRAQFAHFEALFNLENAKNRSLIEVQRVADDQCERHIRSLVALELDEEAFSVCFIPLMLHKLPAYLATEICRKNGAGKWSMAKVRQWIKDDIRAREVGEASFGGVNGFGSRNESYNKNKWSSTRNWQNRERPLTTTSSLAAPARRQGQNWNNRWGGRQKSRRPCIFCNGSHYDDGCTRYRDYKARSEVIKSMRPAVCFTCFGPLEYCRAECVQKFKPCFHCTQTGHNSSLCLKQYGRDRVSKFVNNNASCPGRTSEVSKNTSDKRETPRKERTTANVAVSQCEDFEDRDVAFLPTAIVQVRNESGKSVATGRVLMDSASSRSYITERLCKRLGLENVGSSYLSIGKFGSYSRKTTVSKRVRFKIVCVDGTLQTVLAQVTPTISCAVSRYPIDSTEYPEIEGLQLGEPLNANQRPDALELDVLIGSDQYYNFVTPSEVIDTDRGLVFVGSRVGYLTAGTMRTRQNVHMQENTLVLLLTESAPGLMSGPESFDVERFWTVEDVGIKNSKESKSLEDEEAYRQFESTVKYCDNRYYVAWPWKVENPVLPDNYKLAYSRLHSTWNRLIKEPDLLEIYAETIRNQEEREMVENAPKQPTGQVYYMPHHPVITPWKTTTKVRVVYDASSKAKKNDNSLNDCLLRGQVMIDDLCGTLLRFRMHKIVTVSDIEKAFLQLVLQESQRDVTRFLWLKDVHKPPTPDNVVIKRFTRVFFGAVSSSFLLGATIDYHLKKAGTDIAEKIRSQIYVDNIIAGEDHVGKAVEHYREAKRLFLGAAMNLREFFTNSTEVRDRIEPKDRGKGEMTTVLGLKWNCQADKLSCSPLRNVSAVGVTKRQIMRQAAKMFDPCGFFAPVVLAGKVVVQDMWRMDLPWDQDVPDDVLQRWQRALAELEKIPCHTLPRYVGDTEGEVELHVFSDASNAASGAVVYLRKVNSRRSECILLMAKSRLAPLKPVQTIPRLELLGLEIGVNLLQFVETQLRTRIARKYAWSDSQCVLCWLKKEKLPSRFVANRINKIREISSVDFRYVPTDDNPADLCSRGCSFEKLIGSELWWNGPRWLSQSQENWPINRNRVDVEEVPEEISQLVSVGKLPDTRSAFTDPQRYSSLSKLIRVTAYVLRFVRNLRCIVRDRVYGSPTVQERASALEYWEKIAQDQGFPGLSRNIDAESLRKGSLAQLNVFRDAGGLLRCNTRLDNSGLSFDTIKPKLLPKNHPFTDIVIRYFHVTAMHAGVAQTLANLRQRYWVIHGRNQVRRLLKKCGRCRRIEGGPFDVPKVPPLPEFRVTEHLPFAVTGLDYLGPLSVRTNECKAKKVWLSLFTCAVTRAVHLELVEDQSSEEFHLALRRFFASQGTPKLMVSDNASQFQTVESAMKRLWTELTQSDEFEELVSSQGIEWKKIPQMSPWMGGFYERMIGVVKKFLKKALDGLSLVSLSELRTAIVEIQSVVNSRPLLYVEEGVDSLQLCPADLLGKTRRHNLPTFNESNVAGSSTIVKLIAHWKRIQAITSNFWEIWRQGYLTSLRERQASLKQRNPSPLTPQVGCVVQIKEKLPRGQWRLGKIVETRESADGKIRSVVLQLANGRKLIRPVKLLYPLEMHVEEPELVTLPQNEQAVDQSVPSNQNDDDEEFMGFDSEDVDDVAEKILEVDRQIAEQKLKKNENATNRTRNSRTAKILALAKLQKYRSEAGPESD